MTRKLERFSALAGVLAVALWIIGVLAVGGGHVGLAGGLPEEGADEVFAHFEARADSAVAGGWLFMIGSLAFLWFVGALRSRLSAAEGGVGTFSGIAFAGGIVTGAMLLAMPAGGVVAGLSTKHIGAGEAAALNAVEAVFFIGAELAAIVMLLGAAAAAWNRAVLPGWWAIMSVVLAVWLVIGPIGWIGLLVGLPLWTILTSVLLVRKSVVV